MPCNCSESYNQIDKFEATYYYVPKVSNDALKKQGCKCMSRYRDGQEKDNPFGPSTNDCPIDEQEINPGTITQEPAADTKVDISPQKNTGTSYSPEPKCGGNCTCTPGPSDVTKEEFENLKPKSIKIKCKVKGRKLKCKFQNTCMTPPPDSKPYEPQEWEQECDEFEVEIDMKATPILKKWEQTTPISCSCTQ